MAWKVKFFQSARGKYPVNEFISEQDLATQTKVAHAIRLLLEYGPFLKPPYIKKIQDKLYELRTSGKLRIRIFYTKVHSIYYIVHAFKKKSQKTPPNEIETALDRIKELI